LLRLAATKDPGFSVPYFREMLERFERLPRQEFLVDDATYNDLAQFVAQWRSGLKPPLPQDQARVCSPAAPKSSIGEVAKGNPN